MPECRSFTVDMNIMNVGLKRIAVPINPAISIASQEPKGTTGALRNSKRGVRIDGAPADTQVAVAGHGWEPLSRVCELQTLNWSRMLAIVPTPLCVFERNCSTARKGASTTDNRDLVKAQQPLLLLTSRKYSPGRLLNEQALLTVLFSLDPFAV